jgi:Protein of unknown function (DUF3667)
MDELSKSVPGAEGMVEAEQGTSRKSGNEFCLNCGTKLLDTFCQHCGQKDIPRRQTLGELWQNFIASFWSYEGKFFLTTKFLITKPGFLAIEYNKGHRESYYHPARMYAFISFVFFLVLFSLPDSPVELNEEDKKEIAEERLEDRKEQMQDSLFTTYKGDSTLKQVFSESWVDSLKKIKKEKKKKKGGFSIGNEKYSTIAEYDSTQLAMPEAERDGWFKKTVIIRVLELNKRYGNDTESFGKEFVKAFMDNFSKMLFFLLPVFALVLKLLYVRRDYFYSEHLVFSIYYYNFGYLAASLQLITNQFTWLGWLSTIIGFWIFFYLLFAMKRMYNQSWMKTIAKFSLFVVMFFFVSCVFLAVAAIAVLMVM